MKILITDDEIEIRKVLRLLLESHGHSVTEAKDGAEAVIAITEDNSFDLCIMDIMMPNMSGVEAVEKIRNFSAVPVLFLTAKSLDSDKELAYGSGGDDYIVKPFILPNLLARIEAVLRRSNWQKDSQAKQSKELNKNVNIDVLTPKEKEVLALVAKGVSNQQIADQLCVRDVTVKTHLNSIFKKLKVTNRTQAVLLAMQIDLIN